MTISSSNLLSLLPASSDVQIDSILTEQLTAQLEMQSINVAAVEQSLQEIDFGSMLDQQLTEISVDEDFQGIDNKQTSALFAGFDTDVKPGYEQSFTLSINSQIPLEQDIAIAESENIIAVDWMHSMKTHFSESELAAASELAPAQQVEEITESLSVDTVDLLDESPVPAVAILNLMQSAEDMQYQNGDKLPLSRQAVSAILPLQAASNESTTIKSIVDKTVITDDVSIIDAELDEMQLSSRHAETNLKNSEILETEKLQIKLPVGEQAATVTRDNAPSVLTQASQFSTTVTQNQTNQSLPPSLQSMQLSPQATASEWGNTLGEKVTLLISKQLSTAEIRLDPPHLGKLDIHIQLKDDSATIMINTQHAQTRDLLDSASARLRDFLQEAGYDSVDVEVSHRDQSTGQGDLSQQEDQQHENGDQQQLSSQNEPGDILQSELSMTIDGAKIDYYA